METVFSLFLLSPAFCRLFWQSMTAALNPLKNKFFSWRYEIFIQENYEDRYCCNTHITCHACSENEASDEASYKNG